MEREPRTLWEVLGRFELRELLGYDLYIAIVGAVLGVWVGIQHPEAVARVSPVIAGLVGVVIGAVIAGVALLSAFLDQAFLRKLRLINREPTRYIAPFLFTAVLGVCAAFSLVGASALTTTAPTAWAAVLGGFSGGLAAWTLASLIPDLDMLVQFVRLQVEASEISEEDLHFLEGHGEGDDGENGEASNG